MNPTVFAMRRPVTTMTMVVTLISGGALAYNRMRVDIFPSLNVPKVYVFLDYMGMSPDQMEGFIVNQLELYFQYVDGIQDINTRNIQQVALHQRIGQHPAKLGENVYFRDVATIKEDTDITYG